MLIGFFVMVWVIRYLGPHNFGELSYAQSMVGLFAAIGSLGLDDIVIRSLVRGDAKDGDLLATAALLKTAGGILVAGLAIGLALVLEQTATIVYLVLILSVTSIFAGLSVPDLWFQAKIQSKYSVTVRLSVLLLATVGQVTLILLGASVLGFAALAPMLSIIGGIAFWIILHRVGPTTLELRPQLELARKLLQSSWPLIIAGLSIAIYMKIDQVMLGDMVSTREVGIYATATRLSEMWYFFPLVIASSVFPTIVASRESSSKKEYARRMQIAYDIMVGISLFIAVPLTLFATPVVRLVFGGEYVEAASILKVHIWALVFVSLGVCRGKWLLAENFIRFSMVATLLGAVVNVGLNLMLIPPFGGIGAAWATLLAYAVSAHFSSLLTKETRQAFRQMSYSLILPFRFYELWSFLHRRK